MSPQVRNNHNNVLQQEVKSRFDSRTSSASSCRCPGETSPLQCSATSEPLAAAVLVRETLLPGAAGQRQQQEEDSSHDEDGAGTAHARHRPGELVVQGHRVVAGQQGQDGLVEDQHAQEHQDPWWTAAQVSATGPPGGGSLLWPHLRG